MEHCTVCGHPLDAHEPDNDGFACTVPYFDPLTDEVSFCTCSRTCCLPERCPHCPEYQGRAVGWGGGNPRHICCLCLDLPEEILAANP